MKTPLPAWADFRAFRWRLEPLQRKLRAELDAARFSLASLLRDEKELGEAIHQMDARFVADAKDVLGSPLEPRGRSRSLLYLLQQGQALEARRCDASELRGRITEAREECMAAERRLSSAEKLRGKALAAFASEQMRLAAKDADAAWLAGRSRVQSAEVLDGRAP